MSLPKVVRPGWCLSVFLKVGGILVKGTGLLWACFFFSCKGEDATLSYYHDLARDREKMGMLFAHIVFVQ